MRLIDADALIKQIKKNLCEPCKKRKGDYNGVRCRACQYGDEMDDIEDAPTIEERKKGRWIPHKDYPGLAYLCSACNLFITDRSYFCPNCGAYMKGEEKMNEGLKTDVIDYGEEVFDKVTKYCGKVTGYVHYFDRKPGQYLVESIDTTGRPIEEWIEEGRVEKVRKGK